MKITIEMIEDLISRKEVGFEKAKEALKKADGDLLDAIIYLEDQEKETKTENSNNFKYNDNWLDYLKYDLAFKKNGIDQFSLPIWLFLLLLVFIRGVLLWVILFVILTRHKIYVKR